MFVACSTLCFARHPLEEVLGILTEMEFAKFEAALHEHGRQLRPSEVAANLHQAAGRLRPGPGLAPAAFSVQIDAPPDEADRQFRAICRLARVSTVPLLTIEAARIDADRPREGALAEEKKRLGRLMEMTDAEGLLLAVATVAGTLTEMPDDAVRLCKEVPGLGLTLDPSHYIAGPNQNKPYDQVLPYVRHVRLRDTGKRAEQFQVRVGQGLVEYGRLVSQLARHGYERLLTVDIRDIPDAPFPMQPEVRKLKFLLESLV